MLNKLTSIPQNAPIYVDDPMAPPGGVQLPNNQAPPPESSSIASPSWFGGFFGGNKEEEKKSSGVKTEILESFDSPMPPTFELK